MQWRIRKLSQGYVQTASPEEREAKQAQVERAFLAVMERDPEDVRAYVGLGTLYMRVGRYKEAQEVYGEACALEEGRNAYVWVAMGNLEAKVRALAGSRAHGPACGAPRSRVPRPR